MQKAMRTTDFNIFMINCEGERWGVGGCEGSQDGSTNRNFWREVTCFLGVLFLRLLNQDGYKLQGEILKRKQRVQELCKSRGGRPWFLWT